MEDFYQLAGLWFVALGVDYSINKLLVQQSQEKKVIAYPYRTPKIIQSCAWKYSDLQDSLLFDFSTVDTVKKTNDIKAILKANIPSNYHMELLEKSNFTVELSLGKNNKNEALVNQLMSILKYKGLYIKKGHVWLKPTLTISRQLQKHYFYWNVKISDIHSKDFDSEYTLKLQLINLLNKTMKNVYKEQGDDLPLFIEGDLIFIDVHQIHLRKYGSGKTEAHLLVQEMKTESNSTSVINPSRQLIYASFLHRYLPIHFALIQ